MMLFRGFRVSRLIAGVSFVAIIALVVTVAIVSDGYTAKRVDLDAGTVWVTNNSQGFAGRVNTEVRELNTVLRTGSSLVEPLQDGEGVILQDRASATLTVIDPATVLASESVPLPPQDTQVSLAGGQVLVFAPLSGEVWTFARSALSAFDASSVADYELGPGGQAVLTDSGSVLFYEPELRRVSRVTVGSGTREKLADDVVAAPGSQLVAIGEQWALFDADSASFISDSGVTDLTGTPAQVDGALVQAAGPASGNAYIASSAGLVSVALDGSGATIIIDRQLGVTAQPMFVDGCVYAAWNSGELFRQCGDADPSLQSLSGMPGGAQLVFRASTTNVVLNDAESGMVWSLKDDNRLINNWDQLATDVDMPPQAPTSGADDQQEDTKTPKPPVAVADSFGARPGMQAILPVLLNDYDENGDVLTIDSVSGFDSGYGELQIISNAQLLQLTLAPDASGSFTFDYEISDGRGGRASATVTVAVRKPEENSPPQQVRGSKAVATSGGSVTTNVLGEWFDPDGDPIYLAAASAVEPDTLQYTPEGGVVFRDGGSGQPQQEVLLTVSDGQSVAVGSLTVKIVERGALPIVLTPFVTQATVGQAVTIKPLTHASGGTGALRLSAVPAKSGLRIEPNFDRSDFAVTAEEPGSRYIEYAVTDGDKSAVGLVRLVVADRSSLPQAPVTVPHTAFVREQSSQDISPLVGDYDPLGGLLVLTDFFGVPEASGVRVEILDQKVLRISLTRPITAPVRFGYEVTNGVASSRGEVAVVQLNALTVHQAPVARDDSVAVRVGDAVDIPVLDNDMHPDGDPLRLDPQLVVNVPSGAGLLFAAGDLLRYLAPDVPGNYSAQYRVLAPDGQWATASVSIAVRELDRAVNSPPVPQEVTARVFAGDSVRIPIPLRGIDPDGDSVTLLGQQSNPTLGAVVRSGRDFFEYQAGADSAGTDTFHYEIVDALGLRATGMVRIGIAPSTSVVKNPVAVPDEVMAKPNGTVLVRVLDNDSDPAGGALRVVGVQASGHDGVAEVDGDLVRLVAPGVEASYGYVYEIANERGGRSSNFITLLVTSDAPPARPEAQDVTVRLADILDHDEVDVDVLASVFFADGPASSLELETVEGFDANAAVTSRKLLRVRVAPESQIVPFRVSNPEDKAAYSYAFVRVPGSDDALPQLRGDIDPLRVVSGERLLININDYVVAALGKEVRLTSPDSVRASHANDEPLVVNPKTLSFVSAAGYSGPASISFEVTDGVEAGDPDARRATLALPINVVPAVPPVPKMNGASLRIEPGEVQEIALAGFVQAAGAPGTKVTFAVTNPLPMTVDARIDGSKLVLSAPAGMAIGSSDTVWVVATTPGGTSQPAGFSVEAVRSSRPLAVPQDDEAVIDRGSRVELNVLGNDAPGNPFPDTPLRVVSVRGADSAHLPAGIDVTVGSDRSRLVVDVGANAPTGTVTLQYQIADATGDPQRYVWASVRLAVRDRPEPVTDLRASSYRDRGILVSFTPGPANNSPISGFEVTVRQLADPSRTKIVNCDASPCWITTSGNGRANAVNVSVRAQNEVGMSDPVTLASPVWSDVVPAAPAALTTSPLDGGVRVQFAKPAPVPGASEITSYVVRVGAITTTLGAPTVKTQDAVGTGYLVDVVDASLVNGQSVNVEVTSRNDLLGEVSWNAVRATAVPAGPPIAVGPISALASIDGSGSVSVAWDGAFSFNGKAATRFYLVGYRGGAPSCDADGTVHGGQVRVTLPGTTTSGSLTLPETRQRWNVTVIAFNGQGCTQASPVEVLLLANPAPPTSVSVSAPQAGMLGTSGIALSTFHSVVPVPTPASGGSAGYEFRFVTNGAAGFSSDPAPITAGSQLPLPANRLGSAAWAQFRVVESYPGGIKLYSSWSPTVNLGVSIDANVDLFTLPGDSTRVYRWNDAPSGDYEAVQYSCGGRSYTQMWSFGSCRVRYNLPNVFTVRITANSGKQYTMEYRR